MPRRKRLLSVAQRKVWAKRLGVHDSTINRYLDEGCPFTQGEKAVDEWIAAHGKGVNRGRGGRPKQGPAASLDGERQKVELEHKKAKARFEWLKVHEKEGKLVPVVSFEETVGKLMTEVKTAFLGLPRSVAERMVGLTKPQEAELILSEAVDDILGRLSRAEKGGK